MKPVLELQNIVRVFQAREPVLNGVSMVIKPEEIVGLLGRNGAGKTTLIHIAMGMLLPNAGQVRLFGLSPTEDPVAVKRRIGYVAEDQVLPPFATIAELLSLHRMLFASWDRTFERQLLDRFGFADTKQKIRALSKGQARQVALICAVCHKPELLILDEPAGGLDPAARREFLETSIQLLNREGTSILFSSHHLGDVERLGGRVVLLDGGVIRLDRALDTLREEHCVAIMPRTMSIEPSTIERVPGCLRVRTVHGERHAVFHGAPEAVRRQLAQSLQLTDVRCERVPLEELFIELVGGERLERAS